MSAAAGSKNYDIAVLQRDRLQSLQVQAEALPADQLRPFDAVYKSCIGGRQFLSAARRGYCSVLVRNAPVLNAKIAQKWLLLKLFNVLVKACRKNLNAHTQQCTSLLL